MIRSLFLMMAFLAGCAAGPYRTGSIVINKFTMINMENSNPFDIRPDVLQTVQDSVQKQIVSAIQERGHFKIAQSCKDAEYELVGEFTHMNVRINSHYRFVTITVSREFEADAEGYLVKCGTGERITEFGVGCNDEDFASAVQDMADDVVDQIEREPAPKQSKPQA